MKKQETKEKNKSVLGVFIKNARKKRNLTQSEMAQKLGITQQTYSSYESGNIRMNAEMFLNIAFLLGMSVEHIIEYTAFNESISDKEKKEMLDNMLQSDAETTTKAFEMYLAMLQSEAENKTDAPAIQWASLGIDIANNLNETGQQLIKDYINVIRSNPLMNKE